MKPASTSFASAMLHSGFVFSGMVTTMLGPLLPWMTSRWALTDAQAGYLFTAQFLGSMLGVVVSGMAMRRVGFRYVLVLGYGLVATGVLALAFAAWPFALGCVFLYGIGLGVTIPATNLWVSDANADRRAAALNILNLAWGLGAVACPALVSLSTARIGVHSLLYGVGLALFVLSASLLLLPQLQAAADADSEIASAKSGKFAVPLLLATIATFYLYVGAENAVSGWIASYALRLGGGQSTRWLVAPSLFWGALLGGRAIAPILLRRFRQEAIALTGLLIALIGAGALLVATGTGVVSVATVLTGFGLSSVYPAAIAGMTVRFGSDAPRVAPICFAFSSLGGASLPWLVGFVSTKAGNLRIGLVIPFAAIALLVTLSTSTIAKAIRGADVIAEPRSHTAAPEAD